MSIRVTVSASADVGPDEAFRRLADYESYAAHTSTVRSIEVYERGGELFSTWTVDFRGGLLCWTERDLVDPERRILAFTQVHGDLDRFDGEWTVEADDAGCRMTFAAELDLGIPSLSPIVDPVARQALHDNICTILRGLFAGCGLEFPAAQPAGHRTSA